MDKKDRVSLLVSAMLVFVAPLMPLIVSGNWRWTEAWLFAAVFIIGFIVSRLIVYKKNPDLVKERLASARRENAEPWDKKLMAHIALSSLLFFIAPGIEARLETLVTVPALWRFIAFAVVLGGYIFSVWALVENRFFSGVVRMQRERGQYVVTTGPYRFIRHPGYAGGMLTYPAAAVLFGSIWMMAPVLYMMLVLVIRTEKEDDMLQKNLAGYRQYSQKVRYRLFPGIW